jgi:hypothetical protein
MNAERATKQFLVTHAELKSYIIEKHWEKPCPRRRAQVAEFGGIRDLQHEVHLGLLVVIVV